MGDTTDLLIAINTVGVDGGNGELRLEDLARVKARNIIVGTGGRITGSNATIDADVGLVGGTLAPGLSPGELTIDGNLTVDIDSELIIEIAGTTPGSQYDVLNVLGDATINGEIIFRFIEGFGPSQGQTFDFLNGTGTMDLINSDFLIEGLAPGFEFDVAPTINGFQLISLNDGQAIPEPSTWLTIAIAFISVALVRSLSAKPAV